MTDKQQALRDLLEKVEAGGCHATELPFWKVWVPEEEDGRLAYVAANAYNKSLDAALALHNAVLPEWTLGVGQNAHYGDWSAWVRLVEDGTVTQEIGSMGDDPARALLICDIKALIAKGETDA